MDISPHFLLLLPFKWTSSSTHPHVFHNHLKKDIILNPQMPSMQWKPWELVARPPMSNLQISNYLRKWCNGFLDYCFNCCILHRWVPSLNPKEIHITKEHSFYQLISNTSTVCIYIIIWSGCIIISWRFSMTIYRQFFNIRLEQIKSHYLIK